MFAKRDRARARGVVDDQLRRAAERLAQAGGGAIGSGGRRGGVAVFLQQLADYGEHGRISEWESAGNSDAVLDGL